MSFPVFPQKHEPWFECSICGFDFPLSDAVQHYKKGFKVDKRCADIPTHADYMEMLTRREEHDVSTPQSVSGQGQADFTISPAPSSGSGAGVGGAGVGGAGEGE